MSTPRPGFLAGMQEALTLIGESVSESQQLLTFVSDLTESERRLLIRYAEQTVQSLELFDAICAKNLARNITTLEVSMLDDSSSTTPLNRDDPLF